MPSVSAQLVLTYGSTDPNGAVQQRLPLTFTLAYTEESLKIVHVPASQAAFSIALDSVSAPKFLLVRAIDVDVAVALSDGTDEVPTSLAVSQGWLMLSNPNGQAVNEIVVTTPASPTTGARVQVIAFE